MFGIALAVLASALYELSESIGKKTVRDRRASFYTFGFLSLLASTLALVSIGIVRNNFVFSMESLPTFLVRLFLEIVLSHITIRAIAKADRSDFTIIRMLTVPVLLLVDLSLGYSVTPFQILGIAIIVLSVFFLTYVEKYKTKGIWLILASSLLAVATISLYKYDVTHFNSVEAEQSIISVAILIQFYFFARYFRKEEPFGFLASPLFATQVVASGVATIIGSFAILFAPASVITAALRACAVLFSIISGRYYFRERRFTTRFELFIFISVALWLLAL